MMLLVEQCVWKLVNPTTIGRILKLFAAEMYGAWFIYLALINYVAAAVLIISIVLFYLTGIWWQS